MKIKINDAEIIQKLERIRKDVGGKPVDFIPRPPHKAVDGEIGWKEVEGCIHPSGLLIRNGLPVFVYIRDHSTGNFSDDPADRRKIHFAFCQTLQQMDKAKRFESRYRVTNRTDNEYPVDVKTGWDTSAERLVLLYPCQNCLNQTRYRCFDYQTLKKTERFDIVKSFDAKEAMPFLKQHFDEFRLHAARLKPSNQPAGYAYGHADISRRYRERKGFICEKCGVDLSHRTLRRLTDTHHMDSDKRNNLYENLQCLCKICHKKLHPTYWVSGGDIATIKAERKKQSLPVAGIGR